MKLKVYVDWRGAGSSVGEDLSPRGMLVHDGYVYMPSQKGTTTNVCTLPAKSLRPRPILACKNASEVQQGTLSTQPAIAIIIKCRNVHVQWNPLEHRRQLSLAQQVHVAYSDFLNLFSTPC